MPRSSSESSTIPSTRLIRALTQEHWSISGALAELIDNAFGEERGDASTVQITWEPRRHLLIIADNGRGITRLRDLFYLGSEGVQGVRDPGYFGFGGTKALMHLAHSVQVFSLRARRVARATVNWAEQIESGEWPDVPTWWVPATAANCPTELLEWGQGTLIRLVLRTGRALKEDNVRRDLAKLYGPGFRAGKEIIWQTRGVRGAEPISLSDPLDTMRDVIPIALEFQHEGQTLGAHGGVGYNEKLSLQESRISIGFGFRRIFTTKAPFGRYNALGVVGAVDLVGPWHAYLTSTKDGLDDDRIEQRLMQAIHGIIRPLLERVREQNESLLFKDLGNFLNKMFDGKSPHDPTPDPMGNETTENQSGGGEEGTGGASVSGRQLNIFKPSVPARRREGQYRGIEIVRSTDAQLQGLLCQIEIRAGERADQLAGIKAFVNAEHQYVQQAIAERPPNRHALALLVSQHIAPAIVAMNGQPLLRRVASPAQLRHYETLDETLRPHYANRILLDCWMSEALKNGAA
jgi:Histidine kinase-, DNA gyrase B-, and HSP90-like ATPase